MKKNFFLFLLAISFFAVNSFAQIKCATDEELNRQKIQHPEIIEIEKNFNEKLRAGLQSINISQVERTTTIDGDTTYFEIPVAIHVIHSYANSDYLTDNAIYALIARMNRTYSLQYDTSVIIAPFKKYVGKAYIRFHLATRDPLGRPTTGITRRFSYLTFGGDEQAKVDQWPPTSYYNIWFENVIGMAVAGGTVLAYAHFPSSAVADPYHDGVICAAQFIGDGSTIEHETGHYFSLYHPWNSSGYPCGSAGHCGDDEVDDTPPTIGHPSCSGVNLYDTTCANNYFKTYPIPGGGTTLINYPDTTNVQNMMDYACELMFTKLQVVRMRAALYSPVGDRDSLYTTNNLAYTGALAPTPDLKPIPDFFATINGTKPQYFTCPGTALKFINKSWRDTVTAVTMTFSNGASIPTQTFTNPTFTTQVSNSFTDQGWVNISMKATGNHTGDSTINFNNMIYVADATGVAAQGYFQEFDAAAPGSDAAKWPTFNYFNNEFKWQNANVGYYDNHCMQYTGFDSRISTPYGIYPQTGYPSGDYDDMFSTPMSFSSFPSGPCNLNFLYSGASRSANTADINDSLVISYSTDNAKTWVTLNIMKKGALENKGSLSIPYAPLYPGDWAAKTIALPSVVHSSPYVVFRFRYYPNVGSDGIYSSGNNFYIDRINFSQYAAEVSSVKTNAVDVVVAPNPTSGNAYVIVKDADNTTANVIVSDIAGRTVYTTAQQINGTEARIEIPASVLTVKGIYMVQTRTGNQTSTQKLVVY